MFKCEYCDKEVKTESGLKRHMNSCKAKTVEDEVIVEETISEPSDVSTELQRKIDKLMDARKSMFDAEGRKKIELEIKKISGMEWYNLNNKS